MNECSTCKKTTELTLTGEITFGHGDSGHQCFVICKNCGRKSTQVFGITGGWEWCTHESFRGAIDQWNKENPVVTTSHG